MNLKQNEPFLTTAQVFDLDTFDRLTDKRPDLQPIEVKNLEVPGSDEIKYLQDGTGAVYRVTFRSSTDVVHTVGTGTRPVMANVVPLTVSEAQEIL